MPDYAKLPVAVPDGMMLSTIAMLLMKRKGFRCERDPAIPGLWYVYAEV